VFDGLDILGAAAFALAEKGTTRLADHRDRPPLP
jgi:hypothetical protein